MNVISFSLKMEFQKIVNFLDINSDNKNLPRHYHFFQQFFEMGKLYRLFVLPFQRIAGIYHLTNGLKFIINQKKNYSPNKEIRIKTSMLRSDLCDFNDAYTVVKGNIILEGDNMMLISKIKILHLKIMHHLLIAFQKIMV